MADVSYDLYSKMQTGKPYKTYRKTVLSKVYVSVLNPFSNAPEGIILQGDNTKQDAMVDIWDEKQDVFFKKNNRQALERGLVVPYVKPENFEEIEYQKDAQITDEALEKFLRSKYFTFVQFIEETTTETILVRALTLAKKLEVSEKYTGLILQRLSEIQSAGK